jgi:hypothetical protein
MPGAVADGAASSDSTYIWLTITSLVPSGLSANSFSRHTPSAQIRGGVQSSSLWQPAVGAGVGVSLGTQMPGAVGVRLAVGVGVGVLGGGWVPLCPRETITVSASMTPMTRLIHRGAEPVGVLRFRAVAGEQPRLHHDDRLGVHLDGEPDARVDRIEAQGRRDLGHPRQREMPDVDDAVLLEDGVAPC